MKFWKLTPTVAIASAIALLVAGVAITVYAERAFSRQKIDEIGVQAQILAAIVPAALSFDDHAAAEEYLRSLRGNPEIAGAAIYDENDAYFAGFSLSQEWSPPSRHVNGGPRFDGDFLIVSAPVVLDGARIGAVLVRSVIEPLHKRLALYGGLMLLFVMAAMMVAVLGGSNRALAAANNSLEERARELGRLNAELTAEIAEREKIEAALRQAQKMEIIGRLTGGVAHDFNNLLTIVLGNLERLQRRLRERGDGALEVVETAAANAATGARRAADLTRSLLAFARRQPLDPRVVEPNRLVGQITEMLKRTLGEQISVETVAGAGVWKVLADPNQLESALLNLAVNARDAMPEGGKLTIETSNAYVDRAYIESHDDADIEPGQYVAFAISDTGGGMTPDVVAQAFEPFFTTKGAGHGTGLGLSQVYGFVKQSGGHIKIYSEPGAGTTIRIYLPRVASETTLEADPAHKDAPPRGERGVLVLVVEDDEQVRAHTCALVEELGYSCIAAADGASALRALEARADVRVLFTDVGLPDMTGRQLAEQALKIRPGIKVLYTTGYARNAIVHDGRLDPGVHLVTKPFTYGDVGFGLKKVLSEGRPQPWVLVVEDEPLIRMHLAAELAELGLGVREAGAAAAALEIVRADAEPPLAAIVDLGLPDEPGGVLAGKLREIHPDLFIVIASGRADMGAESAPAEDGRTIRLRKPFGGADLKDALARAGAWTAPEKPA